MLRGFESHLQHPKISYSNKKSFLDLKRNLTSGPLAQSVEHPAYDGKVRGSEPRWSTIHQSFSDDINFKILL